MDICGLGRTSGWCASMASGLLRGVLHRANDSWTPEFSLYWEPATAAFGLARAIACPTGKKVSWLTTRNSAGGLKRSWKTMRDRYGWLAPRRPTEWAPSAE